MNQCVNKFPTPGAVIHPSSPGKDICTDQCQPASRPCSQHTFKQLCCSQYSNTQSHLQQPVSRIRNPLQLIRLFSLSCRFRVTYLLIFLIIYDAGSITDCRNDEVTSYIHYKVACNNYIITHKLKFQLTKEDLAIHSNCPKHFQAT